MNYTEEQQAAIMSEDSRILLLAGAGTGKTSTSIGRLRHLIIDKNVSAGDIICLTFTRSAAEEFKLRCADLPGIPFIGTFHEFCYRLLCCDSRILNTIGYTKAPRILEDFEEEEYWTKLKMQLGVKLSNKKLKNKKLCKDKELFDYETFHRGLQSAFKRDGVINFDQLCQNICNLFITHNPVVRQYQFQAKYIFVDEFQNTDDVQWQFVKSFDFANIFLVGDMMQSIYLFRNATPQITQDIIDDPAWTVLKLSINFRSKEEITNYANTITPTGDFKKYKVDLVSSRGAGGACQTIGPLDFNYLSIALLEEIEQHWGSAKIAILTRTNWDVQKIQNMLQEKGISFNTNNSNTLEDFEHFIRSVQNNNYLISYIASKLRSRDYYDFIAACYFGNLKTATAAQKVEYLKQVDNHNTTSIINKVNAMRVILAKDISIEEKYTELCNYLKITPLTDIEISAPEEYDGNHYLYQLILDTFKTSYDKDAGVYVGTIHSVQGLEYDMVIITDVNSKEFKLDNDENKFVYYVGVTRAKDELLIFTR